MIDFQSICMWVLKQEDSTLSGKIVDLGDGAGLTRLGLTERDDAGYLPALFWSMTLPVAQAIEMAIPVYKSKYWDAFQGDAFTNEDAVASLFSFCVNGGVRSEIKVMQKWFGLTVDGVIGPVSLNAFNAPDAGPKIREAQAAHYTAIYDSNQLKFGRWIDGWLNRARRVYPSLA